MLYGFGYLRKLVMFHFFFFNRKQKIIALKKASWPKFSNIIFLFLLKIGSVGSIDQPINLVSPYQLNFLYVKLPF